jgi:hypothetical protein
LRTYVSELAWLALQAMDNLLLQQQHHCATATQINTATTSKLEDVTHLLCPACICLSQVKLPFEPLQLRQQQQRPREVRVGIQAVTQQLARLSCVAFAQLQASPRDPA